MMYGVYADRSSRCALMFNVQNGIVHFLAMEEGSGELTIDTHKMHEHEFEKEYPKHLKAYPVRRAAEHFRNPITPAIRITDRASKILGKIMTDETTAISNETVNNVLAASLGTPVKKTEKAAKKPAGNGEKKTLSERNIEATKKASIPKTGPTPEVAPVKAIGNVPAKKKQPKGTWDVKPNATEENRDAQRVAVRKHNEAKAKAAKKAEAKAKRAATKQANPKTNNEDKTVTTETKTTAKKTTKPAASKVKKGNGAAAPAKASKAAKKPASKPAKATKAASKPAPAKAATKLAKGTGKATSAAKASGSKGKPAKATKAAKGAAAEGGRRGRKGAFDESQKIKVLVKENPKRQGTASYETFELLKKSKTVGDFFAAGGGSHNLHWNIERGYIEVN